MVDRNLTPRLRSTLALLALAAAGAAHGACAENVAQLRELFEDPAFPMSWEESGMRDGRPLLVNLDDRGGGLFISFVKAGEGLLAEGPARVCRADDRLEARFSREGLRLGTAASWLLRNALRAGVGVRLERTGYAQLRIGTVGWSGNFVPGPSRVGLKPN